MSTTVIQHVLSRLYKLGMKDIFGVAGDYAFPIEDAICSDKNMRWIGCCNELNAAYAADGYARIHGVAALSTTFGVGELSAINGVAGSYAEYLPVFHLVGMPMTGVQEAHRLVHHTLGNGEFDLFYNLATPMVCARAIMTPENCVAETERLIAAALRERRPVYMGFPSDYANTPIVHGISPSKTHAVNPRSDPDVLKAAVTAIVEMVTTSKAACILPGVLVSRRGLADKTKAVVDASNLPFATMFMDKCVIDEAHPNYIGMYDGKLMDKDVCAFIESCDCVLGIGAMMTDFNSGGFTAQIDRSKSVSVTQSSVRVGSAFYNGIDMEDVLITLAKSIPHKDVPAPRAKDLGEPVGNPDGKITSSYMYPRWQQMLKPNDILVTETGASGMGLGFVKMPKGATFLNQTLWGSIGWATPAAFGAAIAAPDRRMVLVTGEGAHQMTAQDVSSFYRYGLKPIIFVVNNDGYLIERMLCDHPDLYYNDLAKWNYAKLPAALGCQDWFTARVVTCGELDEAIQAAESCGTGAYIEVVTDKYEAPPLLHKIHDIRKSFYSV
ncbi:hypothetical protein BGX21_007147 [Mortierella sp. AD011]|nr:hypothetical protein BGX20_007272 [Mortierella sp. AD010]KAF9398872.1 hypothetical protein BGX21_007147 [Mortierella sp. AD011]